MGTPPVLLAPLLAVLLQQSPEVEQSDAAAVVADALALCDQGFGHLARDAHGQALFDFEQGASKLREVDRRGLSAEQITELQARWHEVSLAVSQCVLALGSPEATSRGFELLECFPRQCPWSLLIAESQERRRGTSQRTDHPFFGGQPLLLKFQRDVLRESEALLVYRLGERASFLWIVSRNRLPGPHTRALSEATVLELAPRARIKTACNQLLKRLSQREPLDQSFDGLARELYQLLLPDADQKLARSNSLHIVPDDVLAFLPFEALLTNAVALNSTAPIQRPYLLFDKIIRYAPSLAHLSWLEQLEPDESHREDLFPHVTLLGDAVEAARWDPVDSRFCTRRSRPELLACAEVLALPSEVHVRSQLRNLPRSADVSGWRFDLFVGESANWDRLLKRPPGILHLAASRFWDESCPSVSNLILSRNATGMVGLEGRLPMFRRASDSDLVFLSAAATARGRLLPGDGPQSLARSFLAAGAASVIATQWQISDEAAQILTQAFYQSVLQGLAFEDSLREAKLALLQYRPSAQASDDPPPFANPSYWAPYVLIGK